MSLEKKILESSEQTILFGYESYFKLFINLMQKKKLPNVILFSCPKGIGKSTFAYHLINYFLSIKEENKYSTNLFEINLLNPSFNLMKNYIHPNFFLIDKNSDDSDIKIDKIRDLLKFLSKSTYSKDLKVILIDNAEFLNLNSSNALLKSLEEPSVNTYFFIIHNNSSYLSNTLKSRCVEFKISFSTKEKKEIMKKLFDKYKIEINFERIESLFNFETPGNILKYLFMLNQFDFDISKIDLSLISILMDKYKTIKDVEILCFLTLMIEKYYNNLSLTDSSNVNNYYFKKEKILYLIHNMKTFNLDKKNILISINKILKNEKK